MPLTLWTPFGLLSRREPRSSDWAAFLQERAGPGSSPHSELCTLVALLVSGQLPGCVAHTAGCWARSRHPRCSTCSFSPSSAAPPPGAPLGETAVQVNRGATGGVHQGLRLLAWGWRLPLPGPAAPRGSSALCQPAAQDTAPRGRLGPATALTGQTPHTPAQTSHLHGRGNPGSCSRRPTQAW